MEFTVNDINKIEDLQTSLEKLQSSVSKRAIAFLNDFNKHLAWAIEDLNDGEDTTFFNGLIASDQTVAELEPLIANTPFQVRGKKGMRVFCVEEIE